MAVPVPDSGRIGGVIAVSAVQYCSASPALGTLNLKRLWMLLWLKTKSLNEGDAAQS